jgi:hypothetical protein
MLAGGDFLLLVVRSLRCSIFVFFPCCVVSVSVCVVGAAAGNTWSKAFLLALAPPQGSSPPTALNHQQHLIWAEPYTKPAALLTATPLLSSIFRTRSWSKVFASLNLVFVLNSIFHLLRYPVSSTANLFVAIERRPFGLKHQQRGCNMASMSPIAS